MKKTVIEGVEYTAEELATAIANNEIEKVVLSQEEEEVLNKDLDVKVRAVAMLSGEAAEIYEALESKASGLAAGLILLAQDERYSFLFKAGFLKNRKQKANVQNDGLAKLCYELQEDIRTLRERIEKFEASKVNAPSIDTSIPSKDETRIFSGFKI